MGGWSSGDCLLTLGGRSERTSPGWELTDCSTRVLALGPVLQAWCGSSRYNQMEKYSSVESLLQSTTRPAIALPGSIPTARSTCLLTREREPMTSSGLWCFYRAGKFWLADYS